MAAKSIAHGGSEPTLATFVVRILHRENATWQGEIFWAEENRTEKFRSMLEMVRLIDSALEKEHGPAEPVQKG